MFRPNCEQLENRDTPSVVPNVVGPVVSPKVGIDTPPQNPATLPDWSLSNLITIQKEGGFSSQTGGTLTDAQALQQVNQNYTNWYNKPMPNGQMEGDMWNASMNALALSQPGSADFYLSWIQQPPIGQQTQQAEALGQQINDGVGQPTLEQRIAFFATNPLPQHSQVSTPQSLVVIPGASPSQPTSFMPSATTTTTPQTTGTNTQQNVSTDNLNPSTTDSVFAIPDPLVLDKIIG